MLVNGHWRSIALQVVREPENSHVTESYLRADARVRVHKPLRNCHGSRRKGKNRDKFIDTTDRVRFSCKLSSKESVYILIIIESGANQL
jgi:hypothetical protein